MKNELLICSNFSDTFGGGGILSKYSLGLEEIPYPVEKDCFGNFVRKSNVAGQAARLGFTLAEMMVVMLIMSIIMAAMAPVMTTRMKNDNSSPWKWCEDKVNAYFGNSDKQIAMIGQRTVGNNENNAKLIIRANNDRPNHILFKKGNNIVGNLRLDTNNRILLGTLADGAAQVGRSIVLGQNTQAIPANDDAGANGGIVIGDNASINAFGIAIGKNAKANRGIAIGEASATNGTGYAIGRGAAASGIYSVAIGHNIQVGAHSVIIVPRDSSNPESGQNTYPDNCTVVGAHAKVDNQSISLGTYSNATGFRSIAIGNRNGSANGWGAIAIGDVSVASDSSTIAIGKSSSAQKTGSIAIGSATDGYYNAAKASGLASIAIGHNSNASGSNSIAIGKDTIAESDYHISLGTASHTTDILGDLVVGKNITGNLVTPSDRRLKYVGSENLDGLSKIRLLKPYNYTFKKDEAKTPRVGVMAQDLQKVFPNAVKKGADGFLTIRMEDMFYALINAVKELDAKVTALTNEIKELRKENKEIKQRLKALEAK